MGEYTFLRVDVDAGPLARTLDAVPGVAVADDAEATGETPSEPTERPPATPADDAETDGDDESSPVREWGLLGVGVSLLTLGAGIVGFWVYRRRDGDGEAAETPPPSAGGDRQTPAPGASDAGTTDAAGSDTGEASERDRTGETAAPDDGTERDATVPDTDRGESEQTTAEVAEPTGRSADRTAVEWTTRGWSSGDTESDADDDEQARSERGDGVDVAPLLGVAFLAASGAVVRWLRDRERRREGPTG